MAPKPARTTEQNTGDHADYLAAVDEGLSDAKAGRTVPYEKVRRWLLSWGSGKETLPPKCRNRAIVMARESGPPR